MDVLLRNEFDLNPKARLKSWMTVNNSFNDQQSENSLRGGVRSQGPNVSCRITRSDEGEGVMAWRGVVRSVF